MYRKLTETFPEILETRQGSYDKFNLVLEKESIIPSEHNICILTIKATPFKNVIPIGYQLVDKSFYTQTTNDFLNDRFGLPSTKIEHVKRNLIKAILFPLKPISKLIFGVHSDAPLTERIALGDIKIEISHDYDDAKRFVLIINHSEKTARMLYRERIAQDAWPEFIKFDKDDGRNLISFLKEVGVDLNARKR